MRFTDEEEAKLYQIARNYMMHHDPNVKPTTDITLAWRRGSDLVIVVYASERRQRRDWEDPNGEYHTSYNYHVAMRIGYNAKKQRIVRVVAHHKGSANTWHTFHCPECEYDLSH